jgi:putative oxidoreductase
VHVTFPALLSFENVALLIIRVVVATVFGASGYFHLKDPVGRGKSIEMSPAFTSFLGVAELAGSLGLVTGVLIQPAAIGLMVLGLAAIQKKIVAWETGFWGEKTYGWHYDLMLLAMNGVILTTAGGDLVITL